jgi:hypothetical protein
MSLETQVRDTFAQAINDPFTVPEGQLREIRSEDHAGIRFRRVWM